MADNLTVRVGEGAAPAGGTEGSAKKSKLDQQAEQLGAAIKQRTGRSVDDDVLRAMILRKQAKAERAEQSERSQKDYQKNTAAETLQSKVADDRGVLIGRGREAQTADGLNRHQRQLVTSDPNAPTILPPATHPPITAEAASNVLEKIFGFLKPATADAAPLTIEHYSETLVPRPPTKPGEKNFRDGEQQGGSHLGREGAQLREAPVDRPVSGGTTTGDPVDPHLPATSRPTNGDQPQRPTAGGERPVTEGRQPPVTEGGRPPADGHPVDTGGRPPVAGQPLGEGGRPVAQQPNEGGTLQHPPASNTLHLEKQRLPGQQPPAPPLHSGTTTLGRGVMAGAAATDGSKSTPLTQTTQRSAQTTGGKAPAGGARLRSTLAPLGGEDSKGNQAPIGRVTRDGGEAPVDRPVTGQVPGETDEQPHLPPTGTTTTGEADGDEHPTRPLPDGGRPAAPKAPYEPKLSHKPLGNTVHLEKQRLPGQQQPAPPSHSGTTPLGRGVMAGSVATDGSKSTPLGQTGLTPKPAPAGGKPVPGGRPGGQTPVGGPVGGRPRSAATLGNEKSGGAALSLSLRGGRTTRATDGTTDAAPFVNTGGGFDTTTSWDGMHFNWEAFFVKFMFKFQEDENEARRLMKELRNAMHVLAQEGIKAKIALEKMNQAFERAEKAFEVGAALKSTMEAASSVAQSQQQSGAQGTQPGAGNQPGAASNQPGAPANQPGANGTRPNGVQNDGTGTVAPENGDLSGGETARPNPAAATPGGPPRQGQPAGPNQTPGQNGANPRGANPRGANQPQGDQQGEQQGEDKGKGLPGGGLVGNVSEHLRRDLEKINSELIAAAQRGGGEMDARIRSSYMQAQGLFNQMTQLLAMSRSK